MPAIIAEQHRSSISTRKRPNPLIREPLRAVAAFALSLVVYPIWLKTGLQGAYDSLLASLAGSAVRITQHFQSFASIRETRISALGLLVVLLISYFVVSRRIALGRRLRLFGSLFLVVMVTQVLGIAVLIKLDSAQRLLNKERVRLLLPWEFWLLDGFRYLLLGIGPEIEIFVLMVLVASWNSEIGNSLSPVVGVPSVIHSRQGPKGGMIVRRRMGRPYTVIFLAMVIMTIGIKVLEALRASDARHTNAHVLLGNVYSRDEKWSMAEEQYRAAITEGSSNGEAWYRLADMRRSAGHPSESVALLRRALGIVKDPAWRKKLWEALAGVAKSP